MFRGIFVSIVFVVTVLFGSPEVAGSPIGVNSVVAPAGVARAVGHHYQNKTIVKPWKISLAWAKVHACEEGSRGWHVQPWGGLGIARGSWVQYGGLVYGKTAGDATPKEQVEIDSRLLRANKAPMPHQDYPKNCGTGY